MRRFILLTLVLVFVVAVGAAAQDLSGVDPSGQTITYWNQYRTDSAQDVAIRALVNEFNETNEYGITVEATYQGSYGDIQTLMESAMQSGEVPNLVAAYANAAASWALDGFVVDLFPYYNDAQWGFSDEEKASLNQEIFPANILNFGDFENFLVAWPNQISGEMLVYNADLLAELGYDHGPGNFEEFKEMACAAANSTTEDGTQRKGYGFTGSTTEYETFLAAQGGIMFDYDAGQYVFTSPEALNVFQLFQDLYNEGCGYFSDVRFGYQADFNAGLNLMFMNSTAGFTFIIDGFRDTGYEANWTVQPMRSGEGMQAVVLNVPSIAMITSTPEKQLASWIFLKFLAERENQQAWATGTGYYPLRSDLGPDDLPEDQFVRPDIYPYYMAGLELLNSPDVNVYTTPNFASYTTVRDLVAAAVLDVTVNGRDVMEVATQLEADANEVHEDM